MQRVGRGMMGKRHVPIHQLYPQKSVASAAANPGSEPNIPKVSNSAIQADLSNVVGTSIPETPNSNQNESTVGNLPPKYKYKYKYPLPQKRKRESKLGVDEYHMQQKAEPGEQYRGGAAMRVPPYKKSKHDAMEGIEPRKSNLEQESIPGDQYKDGSTIKEPTTKHSSTIEFPPRLSKKLRPINLETKKKEKQPKAQKHHKKVGFLPPGDNMEIPSQNVEHKEIPLKNTEPTTIGDASKVEPSEPYGEYEKSTLGDPNRLDPITPATGSLQTTDSANSILPVKQLKAAAEETVKLYGPAAVHGTAEERANMGKGALDSYTFQGPYDYPLYPGGRPDDTLTMMGAWKTNNGNDSSLWYSKKTAKGADAKRNKYFKWSMKNGGNWRKLTKDEMVNVFQKGSSNDNRFYGVRAGLKFRNFLGQAVRNKEQDAALGKVGNAIAAHSQYSYGSRGRNKFIDANVRKNVLRKDVPENKAVGQITQDSKEGSGNRALNLPTTLKEWQDLGGDWNDDWDEDKVEVINPPDSKGGMSFGTAVTVGLGTLGMAAMEQMNLARHPF
jgi:hypothetical protein